MPLPKLIFKTMIPHYISIGYFTISLAAFMSINSLDAHGMTPDKEAVDAVLEEIKDYAYSRSKSYLSGRGKICTEYDSVNANRINLIIMRGLEEFEYKGKGAVLLIESSTSVLIEMITHYKCMNDGAFLLNMLRSTYQKNGGTKALETFRKAEEIIKLSP